VRFDRSFPSAPSKHQLHPPKVKQKRSFWKKKKKQSYLQSSLKDVKWQNQN